MPCQGQKISARIAKIRHGVIEARALDVIEKAEYEQEPNCKHFYDCGGCSYQNVPYKKQLEIKSNQVKSILDNILDK